LTTTERVSLALAILLVDLAAVFVPLTGFVAAYVILARPPWFRRFVGRLYGGPA
jgi:hypothetical protein